jgi:hypothetical protein
MIAKDLIPGMGTKNTQIINPQVYWQPVLSVFSFMINLLRAFTPV